jgi:hypothetical protein
MTASDEFAGVTRPTRQDRVLAESTARTTVLLAVDSGTYYELNDVGSYVWGVCDGTRTLAEIVALVVEEYDAPPEAAEADVRALVDELARERLLVSG